MRASGVAAVLVAACVELARCERVGVRCKASQAACGKKVCDRGLRFRDSKMWPSGRRTDARLWGVLWGAADCAVLPLCAGTWAA